MRGHSDSHMLTARHAAIRLLKLMMVASLVLPAVLFAFAAWVSYRNFERVTDERIDRSLDILHEHALKVLQTVERAFAEIDEIVARHVGRRYPAERSGCCTPGSQTIDERSAAAARHRDHRPQRASAGFRQHVLPVPNDSIFPTAITSRRRPTAQCRHLCQQRARAAHGRHSAHISSRCRSGAQSDDGKFNGIVSMAVLPSYFEDFYRAHGPQRGQLLRAGARGRRFPRALSGAEGPHCASSTTYSPLRVGIARGLDRVILFGRFAARPARAPHRLSQARRIPALCARRRRKLGHRERVARLHEQPPDLRPAGDRLPVRRPRAGAAAHQASLRRSRPPRGGGRRAAPVAAAGSDRPTDRRRRARLQQSADDHQRQRAAAARRADRQEVRPAARHDRHRDPARRKLHPPVAHLFAPADADAAGHRSRAAAAGAARTCSRARLRADIEIKVDVPDTRLRRPRRPQRVRARHPQSRGQCQGRHADRRHAVDPRQAGDAQGRGERGRPDRRIRRRARGRHRPRHSRPMCWRACSSRSSPPRRSARAPGWA